jgi:hypothetical protein
MLKTIWIKIKSGRYPNKATNAKSYIGIKIKSDIQIMPQMQNSLPRAPPPLSIQSSRQPREGARRFCLPPPLGPNPTASPPNPQAKTSTARRPRVFRCTPTSVASPLLPFRASCGLRVPSLDSRQTGRGSKNRPPRRTLARSSRIAAKNLQISIPAVPRVGKDPVFSGVRDGECVLAFVALAWFPFSLVADSTRWGRDSC